jgi:hypothetical protein
VSVVASEGDETLDCFYNRILPWCSMYRFVIVPYLSNDYIHIALPRKPSNFAG